MVLHLRERHLEPIYTWTKYLLFLLYGLGIVGIWRASPKYATLVDEMFKVIVGLILIYFFNPMRKTRCTTFHRKVVFSAAVFILLSSSLRGILEMVPVIGGWI